MSQPFSDFADIYDAVIAWDQRLHRELPFLVKQLGKSRYILDGACGVGHHSIALADGGRRVIGVDVSCGMIRRAFKNTRSSRNRKKADFLLAAINYLPFREEVFDAVLCLGATLPLLRLLEIRRTLVDFSRVLAQDGGLICQTRDFPLITQRWKTDSLTRFLPIRTGYLGDGREVVFMRFYDFTPMDGDEYKIVINFVTFVETLGHWRMHQTCSEITVFSKDQLNRMMSQAGFTNIWFFDGFTDKDFEDGKTVDMVFVGKK